MLSRHPMVRRCLLLNPAPRMENTEMIATIYYDGYWAALDGATRAANPFDHNANPNAWRNWDLGWQDAQTEGRVSDR